MNLTYSLSIFQLMELSTINKDMRNLPYNDSGRLYTASIKYRVCKAYKMLPKGTKTTWCSRLGLSRSTLSKWNNIVNQCNVSLVEQGRIAR